MTLEGQTVAVFRKDSPESRTKAGLEFDHLPPRCS